MKIKVNDIFHSNIGITTFYQVVKVYESGRVRIREIEKIETPTDCGYEFLAKPLKNKFCSKKEKPSVKKNHMDIVDNDKGAIKVVKYFEDEKPYLNLTGNDWATLYNGEPVISSYWYVWFR